MSVDFFDFDCNGCEGEQCTALAFIAILSLQKIPLMSLALFRALIKNVITIAVERLADINDTFSRCREIFEKIREVDWMQTTVINVANNN